MSFFEELTEFKKNILRYLGVLLLTTTFFFAFPSPLSSLSVQVFKKIQEDLVPPGVQLIVTNPLSAFLTQLTVSFWLAFAVTLPYFLFKLMNYLSPALYKDERRVMVKILVPSVFLFIGGCLFAYFTLIPLTFNFLYAYAVSMGTLQFFAINEFVTLVLGLMIGVGVMFLLPVFMTLLGWLGVVKACFWRKNWQYALLSVLILAAIITPDGSGVTMGILSGPLIGLYFLGYTLVSFTKKGGKK
jgi:sec-independent protein translocase protein TatC